MTGLETYMSENGWTLSRGKTTDWNTYDNCGRLWKNSNGGIIIVGLLAQPTRVGLIYPLVILNGKYIESLPTSGFESFLNILLTLN